jgi:hypothetical protein
LEQQYYIPSLEDFRSGFEFELFYREIERWNKEIFNSPIGHPLCCVVTLEYQLKDRLWSDSIRVPYLTAEQIVAEGWTQQINENIYFISVNSLCGFRLYTDTELHDIEIERVVMDGDDVIYKGSCRCINDFRLICKLLNIK